MIDSLKKLVSHSWHMGYNQGIIDGEPYPAQQDIDTILALTPELKLGATGAFPEGKLDEHDQGQLRMLLSHDDKNVRLDFGKSVAWIAMPTNEALTIAFAILEHCGVVIEHKIMQNPTKGEGA